MRLRAASYVITKRDALIQGVGPEGQGSGAKGAGTQARTGG